MREQGLTLVELMVVVAIVGILATLAVFTYTKQQQKVRASEVNAVFAEIQMRQEQFHLENGRYLDIGGDGEAAADYIPDMTTEGPSNSRRPINLATGGADNEWEPLRLNFDKSQLYCAYTVIANETDAPQGTAAQARLSGSRCDILTGIGPDAAVLPLPPTNWYCLIAICDLNGDGEQNPVSNPTRFSEYVKFSTRERIVVVNQGE